MSEATASIGHNNPPEPTPYDKCVEDVEAYYNEAKSWLDGDPIDSEPLADGVSKLLDSLRKLSKEVDACRKEEAKPFDDGKKEVQERYNPLLEKCKTAQDVCKKALTPWLEKLDAEKRAKEEAARKEAEEKRAAAQEEMRKAQESADLEARERAEAMAKEAKKAEAAADRASKDKAHAKGGARAVGLRTVYEPEITDPVAAARHFWTVRRTQMDEFILTLARQEVDKGIRNIPGVVVHERKVAQ